MLLYLKGMYIRCLFFFFTESCDGYDSITYGML